MGAGGGPPGDRLRGLAERGRILDRRDEHTRRGFGPLLHFRLRREAGESCGWEDQLRGRAQEARLGQKWVSGTCVQ